MSNITNNNSLLESSAVEPAQKVFPGLHVQTVKGEIDTDADGAQRQTEPGTWGVIAAHNHADHWDLTFPGGGWVVVTEAELADPTQYRMADAGHSESSQGDDRTSRYVHHASTGDSGIFTAKYDQHANRDGQRFTVLGALDPSTYDADECGELFVIQFSDGHLLQAWPEEVQGEATVSCAQAQALIDEFAAAVRALAWTESNGDQASESEILAVQTAEAKLLARLQLATQESSNACAASTQKQEDLQRLMRMVRCIPLGDISQQRRSMELAATQTAIRHALDAGISEEAIFVCLHDGQRGWPSEKVAALVNTSMSSTIMFMAEQQQELFVVRFTMIAPGQPLGHGREGVAQEAKVVCTAHVPGSTGGQQQIVSAATLAQLSGRVPYAPFAGVALSVPHSCRVRDWVREHLTRIAQH